MEWFAEGNNGDRHTEPQTNGDVHCTIHDQEDGTTSADCWRWSDNLAVTVAGIKFPNEATCYVAPAIEGLYSQIATRSVMVDAVSKRRFANSTISLYIIWVMLPDL